jgi:GNAT superfamily N-acetyltransferase
MNANHISNLWNKENIKWENLAKTYIIEDFYLAIFADKPVGCMVITDFDLAYWPEIKKGTSLYIHKLAVKREARGKGISKELIDYAKQRACSQNINTIRLDCNANRDKLRMVYQKQDFRWVKNVFTDKGYEMSLYIWNRKEGFR